MDPLLEEEYLQLAADHPEILSLLHLVILTEIHLSPLAMQVHQNSMKFT